MPVWENRVVRTKNPVKSYDFTGFLYGVVSIACSRRLARLSLWKFYFVMMTNSAEPAGPVMVRTVSSLTFVKVRMPSAPFVTVQLAGF